MWEVFNNVQNKIDKREIIHEIQVLHGIAWHMKYGLLLKTFP